MKKLTFLVLCFLIAGMQLIQAQPISITGRTTDASTGEALPGVTIQVRGTTVGAISQADGTYSISNVPGGSTQLIFSFVGYETQEIVIAGRTVIDVAMEEEVTALEEIVVTGYSVERKKDIIGSVAVVNTEDMLTQASGAATSMLQGRVAGVTISSDGDMDGAAKVRIRGFGSFGGSDPLYIIDGVPGLLDRLNANDIESIQVLKDAASASVYGARAANGVVIITTKTGKIGATKVNVDAYYGINYFSPNDFPELVDAMEWGEIYWKSMEGAGRSYGDPTWTHPQYGTGLTPVIPEYILVNANGSRTGGAALEALRISDPTAFADMVNPDNYDYATHQIVKSANTDWFDEVFDPAPITNVQLTASGGSERGTYVISLNYYDTKPTDDVDYSYMTRYTVRANTTFNIKDIIRLGENVQIRYGEGRSVGRIAEAWTMCALMPVWDIAGNPAGCAAPGIISVGDTGRNPIGEAWHNRFDKSWTWIIFGNVFAEVEPIQDLVLRTSFGIDITHRTSKDLSQVTYEHAENTTPPNSLTWRVEEPKGWTFTNTLTYTKTLGRHTVKILLGTEAIDWSGWSVSTTRQDFLVDDDEDFLVIDAGTGGQSGSGTRDRESLFSLFGRLDYTFADKYIINGTIRRDGSSKFGINNRYGIFPSVAVGWRITGEEFMQGITWLTDLKIRGSYGIIGNQTGLSPENQFTTFVQTINNSYGIQGANTQIAQSFTQNRQGNPDAKWEKAISTNVGFDATLFAGALTLDFNYFIRETRDLLVENQAPYTGPNVSQPDVNVGNIQNKGVDFTATYRGRIAGQVDFEVSGNFSHYKNEVLKVLDNPEATLTGGGTRMGSAALTKQGNPIAMFYGYHITGFYNTQDEVVEYVYDPVTNPDGYQNAIIPAAVGRWRLQDVNGDKIVNDLDRTYIGDPHPDFQVGLNISLAYKGFDLTGFFFWNQGGDIFNYARYRTDFNTFQYNRSDRMLYDSWTPEKGDDALLPKLDLNDTYSNTYVTDYFVEDATYLRLKQAQLGYTVPASLLNRIGLDKLRIYVSAQNLFTITDYSGLDPGISIQGNDDLSMGVSSGERPTPKQILFGINLGF